MAILSVSEANMIKKAIHDRKLPSLDPGTIWISKWAGKTPRDQPYLTKALNKAWACAHDCNVAYKTGHWEEPRKEWREAIAYYKMHKKLQAKKPVKSRFKK